MSTLAQSNKVEARHRGPRICVSEDLPTGFEKNRPVSAAGAVSTLSQESEPFLVFVLIRNLRYAEVNAMRGYQNAMCGAGQECGIPKERGQFSAGLAGDVG